MLALFKQQTFSKFQCVFETRRSRGGSQTKIGLMQEGKYGINLIDWSTDYQ